jgi:hypothetical protein
MKLLAVHRIFEDGSAAQIRSGHLLVSQSLGITIPKIS